VRRAPAAKVRLYATDEAWSGRYGLTVNLAVLNGWLALAATATLT
jgi:hypothetical protein